jgi:hypothetical protein
MIKVSEKRIVANQKNAQKSTGAKTPRGKAMSKYNAIKHGILLNFITRYEEDIYKSYLKDLVEEYNPVTFTDRVLVERAAQCYVRLFRCAKAEGEQIREELNPRVTKDIFQNLIEVEVVDEGYSPRVSAGRLERIEQTILRYERSAEKTFYRAIYELERRKAKSKKENYPSLGESETNYSNS